MTGDKARPVSSQVPVLKEHVRSAIYRGDIPIGTRIVEEDLQSETGASLRAIRKALAELAREGLVERKRHAGTFVAQTVSMPASEPLRKVHSIGILSSLNAQSLPKSTFVNSILNGVKAALTPPALITHFLNPDDGIRSLDDTPAFSSALIKDPIQGVLAIETSNVQQLNEWTRAFGPVIAVDFYSSDPLFDAVAFDHQDAGYQAASHLLALGHRRIAFVGERISRHSSDPTWQDRLVGYLRALLSANISPNAEWIIETQRSAGKVVHILPDFHRSVRPSAYVLCSSNMFEPAKQALASLDLSCPKDVSLACADAMMPITKVQSASCVRPNFEALGQAAVKLLASRLTCRTMPPVRVTIPIAYSPGASCRSFDA